MMGELEKRLKQLIDQKSGSVAAFARETGIPATTIYNALNRGIAGSTTDTVTRLYDALGVDWSSLSDFDSSRSDLKLKSDESGYEEIPLYGSIAAGVPTGRPGSLTRPSMGPRTRPGRSSPP